MKNDDRWLDALLQQPHVDDDGFADRVAAAVPAAEAAGGRHRGVVWGFVVLAVVFGAAAVVSFVDNHGFDGLAVDGFGARVAAALAAALVVAAAAVSGEGLRLRRLHELALAGPAAGPLLSPEPTSSSATMPQNATAPPARGHDDSSATG